MTAGEPGGGRRGATVPQQDRSAATRRRLLDAAVDELVAVGYSRLTTAGVAARAGVSRGAQQHHFPHKATLVTEAIAYLGTLQLADLRALGEELRGVAGATEEMLDAIFETYSKPLFAATLELAMAARFDPELQEAVNASEHAFSREIAGVSATLLGAPPSAAADSTRRLALVLSAVRGVVLLRMLGHEETAVRRQWSSARGELLASLQDRR